MNMEFKIEPLKEMYSIDNENRISPPQEDLNIRKTIPKMS